MEIIAFELAALEAIEKRFERFEKRVNELCSPFAVKKEKWLDNQDVCQILNISKRTLQNLRTTRKLAYSQIGNKVYYKVEDIENLIRQGEKQ
jgi:hypothetical protein